MSGKDNKRISDLIPLGRTLANLGKSYFGALTKKLELLDIDRHFSVLLLIESRENSGKSCCQQFIADALQTDKVSMVRMVDYLIDNKYISKSLNPNDRREYFLKLTSKAKKELPKIKKSINELNKIVFKGLKKDEVQAFYNAIAVMESNLAETPADEVVFKFRKAKK